MSRTRRIHTPVGELHVREVGNPRNASVVLWPSLYCTGAIWSDQVDVLGAQYHLLIVDPPGHGDSGVPPRRFTLEATADATRTVLDSFAIDDVAIVGGAWGGMVGVQLAASSPARVRGLVLINSPLDRWRGRQRVEVTLLTALLRAGGPAIAAPLVIKNMLSAAVRHNAPERARSFEIALRSLDRRGLYRSARAAMLDRPSLLPLLPHLAVPVLAIAGGRDSLWPVSRARAEVAAIPGARFEVIPETAHLSAFEAPHLVNPMLIEFLHTIQATPAARA